MGLIRADKYRSQAPTLRLSENPVALCAMVMASRMEEQERRNWEDQLELFKTILRLQDRVTKAEADLFNVICFIVLLIKGGVVSVNHDLLDQIMRKFAETTSKSLLP